MTQIETLRGSGSMSEAYVGVSECFTPPILHIREGDISLTRESIVRTLEELIAHEQHVLLLGEPGSGKSTLLREMLHEYETHGSQAYDTVMYLPLRAFETSGESFLDFFRQKTEIRPTESKNVLWVLDGMDEVKNPEHIASLLEEIRVSRPGDHIIVAARPIVQDEGFFKEYTPVAILPFGIDQILFFAEQYSRQQHKKMTLPLRKPDGELATLMEMTEQIVRQAFRDDLLIKKLLSTPVALPFLIDLMASGNFDFPVERTRLSRVIIDCSDSCRWSDKDPDSFLSVFAIPDLSHFDSLYSAPDEIRYRKVRDTYAHVKMIRFYVYIADHMMTEFGQPVIDREKMKHLAMEYFAEEYAHNVMSEDTLPADFCEERAEMFLQAAEKSLPLIIKLDEDGYGFAHRSLYEYLVAQSVLSHERGSDSALAHDMFDVLKKNDMVFSLQGRETVRMMVELLWENGHDNVINKFFRLVLSDSTVQPHEPILAVASYLTEKLCTMTNVVQIRNIYSALENAIAGMNDAENPSALYRLQKQLERLRGMIQEKGLQEYMFRTE